MSEIRHFLIHSVLLILSHPLYFAYFIFFSPYLLKLAHFLSPLFVTISLLSLAFFNCLNNERFVVEMLRFENDEFDDLGMYEILFGSEEREKLQCSKRSGDLVENEVKMLDDLMYEIRFGSDVMEERENQVEFSEDSLQCWNKIKDLDDEVKISDDYEILFGSTVMEERENPAEVTVMEERENEGEFTEEKRGEDSENKIEDSADNEVEFNGISGDKLQNSSPKMEEKRLENFLKILDEFERMSSNVEEKKLSRGAKADKAVEKTKAKADELLRNGSEAARDKAAINGGKEHTPTAKAESQKIASKITSTIEEFDGDRSKNADAINGGKEHTPAVKKQLQRSISTIEELGGGRITSAAAINGGKEHTPAVKAQPQRSISTIEDLGGGRITGAAAAINGGKEQIPAVKAQLRQITSTIEELEGDRNTNENDAAINGGKKHTPATKAPSQKITSTIEESAINGGKEQTSAAKAQSQRITSKIELQVDRATGSSSRALMAVNSYGSMRKEKEWKRTLACKLFEERHNVDGGEGMDSLWEAYETDSIKNNNQKKNKNNKHKKIEEYDEEDEIEGQLCCLQALKLSSGKMNMGMGRPNLVKITKAIKGFGWLSKHSKKVHNNNGDRY